MADDHPGVLIVEDDRVGRMKLEHVLKREMGITPFIAEDGEQAWQLFQQEPVKLIVSDWMMPGCSGPELCQRVRETTAARGYTYFILLTGKTESLELVEGLAAGADDYIRKPFDNAEFIARMRSGLRVLSLQSDLAEAYQQLEDTFSKQREAVHTAGLLQKRSLPKKELLAKVRSATGIDIAYRYESCDDLGGDIIGMSQPAPGQVAVYMADVSGHGIAPSLLAVSLNTYLQTLLQSTTDPASVGEAVHKFCGEEFPDGTYATMVYVLMNTAQRTAEFLVAGHPPVIRVTPDGSTSTVDSGSAPVGLLSAFPLEPDTSHIELHEGEKLLIYTDGLTETRNSGLEFYSTENLVAAAARLHNHSPETLLDKLQAEVLKWRGGPDVPPDDDISLLAIGVGAAAASG